MPVANLNSTGAANNVNITVNNLNGNFDGRLVYASLWDVYQKASLNNTFQYAVAEGSGDIYSQAPGTAQSATVASRWVDLEASTRPSYNPQSSTLYILTYTRGRITTSTSTATT